MKHLDGPILLYNSNYLHCMHFKIVMPHVKMEKLDQSGFRLTKRISGFVCRFKKRK